MGYQKVISGVGIGLKIEHFELMLQQPDYVDFVEIHAENYMVPGGAMHHYLQRIYDIYPLSLHGVGLSIGSDAALDEEHIDRLKALIDRYQPQLFSEHLAWSSHGVNFYNDLLPLAYTNKKLNQVCEHIDHLQHRLQRQMLLENPSTYVEFSANEMEETDFISEVVKRTGCGLLLDVNNVYVSAVNHQRDPYVYLQQLPLSAVQQMHIAGYSEDQDANGERLLIDSHSEQVSSEVWQLYLFTLGLIGTKPTLLERDNNIPAFSELQKDLYQIQQAQQRYSQGAK
ncbi:DUF692 domain-containing protein [Gallibacterium genomosp. 3]|uniref:UPF0276 protein QV07_00510 n=1 Tax=Gallibacterium genomosp. 3 TaxID=505345 RepID=A0A1A7QCX9_9PAST|nr:DUF692 domain-containing protein [Gallibacterium genomosp. 3]OBX12014.1 hypothetical protein QV07_00510 [Gallibacterium genomosp. 3]